MRLRLALATLTVGLTLPGAAAALPSVTVHGRAVPIPGFPHTGNYYGAGAAVQSEISISGSEYAGNPPPLIGIDVYLPTGVRLHPHGFPTCPLQVIMQEREPRKCPPGSRAGPPGTAAGVVSLAQERVAESTEIDSFFAPGGGFEFIALGHSPISLEVPSLARLLHPGGLDGFGPEFDAEVPLVQTVPGAPDASVESIQITLGSAIRRHGKPLYYGTVPRSCPAGGFRVKADFIFAQNGQLSMPETVTVPFRAPCPTS